ncbi:MAG: iron ABC transporter permease [Parvularculales bacterium]
MHTPPTPTPLPPTGYSTAWVFTFGTLGIALIIATPLVATLWLALTPTENDWPQLLASVLPNYVFQTTLLLMGVGLLTLTLGTGAAWLVTMCTFPGRRFFTWGLLIPLAMPTYITAYAWVDLMEFAGPIQTNLRAFMGWQAPADYWFPPIRSLPGAIMIMGFVLYPYVYLTARAAFLQQSTGVLEVSRTLGRGSWSSFYSVALPLARPALAAGLLLVLMECLNDIGAVEHFGVRTLTIGIYDIWLERGNLGGAAQISAVMLLFVLIIIALERHTRRNQRYYTPASRYQHLPRHQLAGLKAVAALIGCTIPLTAGFLIPGAMLVWHAAHAPANLEAALFAPAASNSLLLAATATLIIVLAGLFLAYAGRLTRIALVQGVLRFASIGYAIPGAILAIGILIPLTTIDRLLDNVSQDLLGIGTGLIFTGSLMAILFAYLVRFLALSFNTMETGLNRVTPTMDMAARNLGYSVPHILWRVHFPLIRPAVLTAGLLVFVDTMKELPITLILRPFNFDTLATHVYTVASLGLLEQGAQAALIIVLAGLAPIIVLTLAISNARPGYHGISQRTASL